MAKFSTLTLIILTTLERPELEEHVPTDPLKGYLDIVVSRVSMDRTQPKPRGRPALPEDERERRRVERLRKARKAYNLKQMEIDPEGHKAKLRMYSRESKRRKRQRDKEGNPQGRSDLYPVAAICTIESHA